MTASLRPLPALNFGVFDAAILIVSPVRGLRPVDAARLRVRADFQFRRKPGRREWLRARLRFDSDQALLASIYHTNSSGALSSLCWADGLIELPEDCAGVAPGDTVDYLPFNDLDVE